MPAQPSRRTLLTSSLAGVAALGVIASERSEAATTPAATHALPVSHDPSLHAARRLSFGATPDLVATIRKQGVTAWLDDQLKNSPDVDATLHGTGIGSLPLPPSLTQTIDGDLSTYSLTQIQAVTVAKAAFADNQVFELMVELWSNHLSIFGPGVAQYKALDDQNVIRKHALGKFSDMLAASAQSPAMLFYLDNAYSYGNFPNENYARELMELHTVGATAGYTQKDVHNAALALTGMSVDSNSGEFTFNVSAHHVGPVRVMGWYNANADQSKGKDVALSLVDYLAHHPATATRIATKLCRRLVSDNPPAALITSAAAVFRANDTAIKPVIQHIVASVEFQHGWGQKQQRPLEWFMQAVRALGVQPAPNFVSEADAVIYALREMGQAPFEWSPPNGYPDVAGAYASTAVMLARWNVALALVNGNITGLTKPKLSAIIGSQKPATVGDLVDAMSRGILQGNPRAGLKRAVCTGVGLSSTHAITPAAANGLAPTIAALLISSPEAMVR